MSNSSCEDRDYDGCCGGRCVDEVDDKERRHKLLQDHNCLERVHELFVSSTGAGTGLSTYSTGTYSMRRGLSADE